jgi:nitrogen fixation NifU-like protein
VSEFADLYQDVVMKRSREPRHAQRLERFDATAKGDNPMCGDRVQVWVALDGDTVGQVGFEARGCAISVASADLMAEAVQGRTTADTKKMFEAFRGMVQTGVCPCAEMETLAPLSGVHEYKSRIKCATLPWFALTAALDGTKETSSE